MSGRVPEAFIRSLLDRADIVEYVGAGLRLAKKGKDHWACCPFHQEKTPSFKVSADRQNYYCFGCKASGNLFGFIMARDNVDFVQAIETLAAHYGMEVPYEGGEHERPEEGIYEVLSEAAACFVSWLRDSPKGAGARDYLHGRGLKKETTETFSLGFVPAGWDNLFKKLATSDARTELLHKAGLIRRRDGDGQYFDMFRARLMFPIRDARGRIIGFGGRALEGDGPKYLNSPQTPVFHKARELYGLYEARQASRRIEQLILVEGYTDVLTLHQAGLTNSVATLGTAASEQHFASMFRHTDELLCCFDGDSAGRSAAHSAMLQAIPALRTNKRLKFAFLPEGEDPDSLVSTQGAEVFCKRLSTAELFSEYFFEEMRAGLDLKTLEDQARLRHMAEPDIERLPQGPLKVLMRSRLAELTGGVWAQDSSQPFSPRPRQASRRNGTDGAKDHRKLLRQRMLSILIRHPSFFAGLDEAGQQALLAGDDGLSALAAYLGKNKSADAATIHGFFLGSEHAQAIGQAAATDFELASDLLARELSEGAGRIAELEARESRKQALRKRMRAAADAESEGSSPATSASPS